MPKNNFFPKQLQQLLEKRKVDNAFRLLSYTPKNSIDFSSNDYLGFAKNPVIQTTASSNGTGASGSRLLTGNNPLYTETEQIIANFHNQPTALIYPSGYMANTGLLSAVLQRHDIVLYDEFCHTSIKDGIRLSLAKGFPFKHNNISDLASKLKKYPDKTIYIVTESVFSMDGDMAPLQEIIDLINENHYLIVDEAHAIGVVGCNGEGLTTDLQLDSRIFAKVVTFGKAVGTHGAAVLGSLELRNYLINFSRPFIYTTGLNSHTLQSIKNAYNYLKHNKNELKILQKNIYYFNKKAQKHSFLSNNPSAIQVAIIPNTKRVKAIAHKLQQNNFDVRPILSPTVKKGSERLRIVLHSFNTFDEIDRLIALLEKYYDN